MNKLEAGALALVLAALAGAARAQDYPVRPLRLISPFPPGGFNDTLSRLVGQKLTVAWGQQVVVDNRPGANMIVGTSVVAKAAPDGYTMFMAAIPHAINPSLYKLPYDSIRDFTPVAMICEVPNLLVVHPTLAAKSVKELIAYAKANPGKLSFGSTGNGSSSHMAGELLKVAADIDMVHVPYKGAAPALVDLVAGRLQVYIGATTSVLPHARAGKLRALGVTTAKRVSSVPDIPTVLESGVPGFEVSSWYGLVGPAGMPAQVVSKINAEIRRIAELPDVRDVLSKGGAEVATGTAEEFARTLREDIGKWMRVVKATGVKAD
ncbi:MAG: tripartite tricarboxylate transporter substrate binding protein [Burkholderiales bacterium]|nr:tripartite tricarboxylate transporter substrate binding protein [Burkholderiales bacterium]